MTGRASEHRDDDEGDDRPDELNQLLDSVDERHALGSESAPSMPPPPRSPSNRVDIPVMTELLEVLRTIDQRLQAVERQIGAAAPVAVDLPGALRDLHDRLGTVEETMRTVADRPPIEEPPASDVAALLEEVQGRLDVLRDQVARQMEALDLRPSIWALTERVDAIAEPADPAPALDALREHLDGALRATVGHDAINDLRERLETAIHATDASAAINHLRERLEAAVYAADPATAIADLRHHVDSAVHALQSADVSNAIGELREHLDRTIHDTNPTGAISELRDHLDRTIHDTKPTSAISELRDHLDRTIHDTDPTGAIGELRGRIDQLQDDLTTRLGVLDSIADEVATAVVARQPAPSEPPDPNPALQHLQGLLEGVRDRIVAIADVTGDATEAMRSSVAQLPDAVADAVAGRQPAAHDLGPELRRIDEAIAGLPGLLAGAVAADRPEPTDHAPALERLHEAISFLRDHVDAVLSTRDPSPQLRSLQDELGQLPDRVASALGASLPAPPDPGPSFDRMGERLDRIDERLRELDAGSEIDRVREAVTAVADQVAVLTADETNRAGGRDEHLREITAVIRMCLDEIHDVRRAVDARPSDDAQPTSDLQDLTDLVRQLTAATEDAATRQRADIDRIERTLSAVVTSVVDGQDAAATFRVRAEEVAGQLAALRAELEAQRTSLVSLGEAYTRISRGADRPATT